MSFVLFTINPSYLFFSHIYPPPPHSSFSLSLALSLSLSVLYDPSYSLLLTCHDWPQEKLLNVNVWQVGRRALPAISLRQTTQPHSFSSPSTQEFVCCFVKELHIQIRGRKTEKTPWVSQSFRFFLCAGGISWCFNGICGIWIALHNFA